MYSSLFSSAMARVTENNDILNISSLSIAWWRRACLARQMRGTWLTSECQVPKKDWS